jgi:amino-acid N-acetyltransferase
MYVHVFLTKTARAHPDVQDFILSILRANPSTRDTKNYLQSFGFGSPAPRASAPPPSLPDVATTQEALNAEDAQKLAAAAPAPTLASPLVAAILNPVQHRTALVKLEGPFTDRQLESIARGMVYLAKLGLLSVIVVEDGARGRDADARARAHVLDETARVAAALERQGAKARPFLGPVVRLGPHPDEGGAQAATAASDDAAVHDVPEAHTFAADLAGLRSGLRAGEIPVLAPLALDSHCRTAHVAANDVLGALAKGMVDAAVLDKQTAATTGAPSGEIDLTPLRLMVINRDGGVPSYARAGLPHLLINTTAEFRYIQDTFQPEWRSSHPSALANLALARTCLHYMPPTSSAVMVSHRSPSSLIANLITNKPAVSSSLPHALLQGQQRSKLNRDTPTLLRRGQPIHVLRSAAEIDRPKLRHLLEQSFRRTLDEPAFYARLERTLDFVIVAGDYAGAAIVTNEGPADAPLTYLDKFAVLPSHQGDGTVDFLWVALHDESYGLGLPYSANPNGGRGGQGTGRDLVWRSRADNPVNKWYFERSTGHVRMGDKWVLFWCDAEVRLKVEEGRRANQGLGFVESWEEGRLDTWAKTIDKIPSVWK